MQILAGVIFGLGIFLLGRAYEAHKLANEWQEVEAEWMNLEREKLRWRSDHLRN